MYAAKVAIHTDSVGVYSLLSTCLVLLTVPVTAQPGFGVKHTCTPSTLTFDELCDVFGGHIEATASLLVSSGGGGGGGASCPVALQQYLCTVMDILAVHASLQTNTRKVRPTSSALL